MQPKMDTANIEVDLGLVFQSAFISLISSHRNWILHLSCDNIFSHSCEGNVKKGLI